MPSCTHVLYGKFVFACRHKRGNDLCDARNVRKDFIAACRHLVAPGGVLAAMKGAAPAPFDGAETIRLNVPFLDAERHLVLVHLGD